jgi:hypothetical protein
MIGLNQCEHGSLKRQCLTCELQDQLKAADELAKAAKKRADLWKNGDWKDYALSMPIDDEIVTALSTYERVRGGKA